MAVENKYITVAYKLYTKEDDEEVETLVEQCNEEHPFQFISKLGVVLPAFEEGVANVEKGGAFDFVIPCKDAYGEFNEELMFDVEKSIFMIDGKFDDKHIFDGNIVPMRGEDGSVFNATIIEVKEDAVTLDLNHPRAGQDLHFVGTVVENRVATNEEVSELLNMMSGGCGGHCGGGCGGNCGGSCGGDCGGDCGEGGCGCK